MCYTAWCGVRCTAQFAEVLAVMRDLAKFGVTMVVVTHEVGFAREVADEVLFFDDGLLVEKAEPATFFASPQTDRARTFLEKVLSH